MDLKEAKCEQVEGHSGYLALASLRHDVCGLPRSITSNFVINRITSIW